MPATPAELSRRALADHLAALPAGQLLTRYATSRDPEAFAGLVHQFGPLVLGTCRRVLGPSPDADDAFQAVFLALSRQAGSFRDARGLPAWLHRVSLRVSHKALARRDPAAALPEAVADPADPFANVAWKDVRRVLDEEIDALPEKYRGPVVLCWLDGLTQDEAAGKLGLSLNTLKRRLDAGRELLRSRLLRRGLSPVLVTAVAATPTGLQAVVPPTLVGATLEAVVNGEPTVATSRLVPLVVLTATAACGLAVVSAWQAPPDVAPPPRPVLQPQAAAADTHPPGAVATFGSTHFRVPGDLRSSALSPDGKLFAAGGNPVRVFEAATWKPVRQFDVEGNALSRTAHHLAFSPDGRYLAGANTQFAYVWDLGNGKLLHRLDGGAMWRWTQFCAFTPDGLLALSDKEKLRFFDPATGREVQAIAAGRTVALSPDGRVFLRMTNYDGRKPGENEILLFGDVATGKELFTLDGFASDRQGVAFAPDGKSFALLPVGSDRVEVWDVAKKTLRQTLKTEMELGRSWIGEGDVGFTADGKTVFAREKSGGIIRWDAATGKELPRLRAGADPPPGWLHALPDGKTLLTPTALGWVRVWEAATGEERPIPGRYWQATIALAADGKLAAVGDRTGRVDLLDAVTGKRVRSLRECGTPVQTLVFSPDSALLAVREAHDVTDAAKRDARLLVLRVSDGNEFWSSREAADAGESAVLGFAASEDADLLIVCGREGEARVWNVGTGKVAARFKAYARNAVPSPDGKRLAAEDHGEVVVFDTATGREAKRILIDPEEKVRKSVRGGARLAWSADGRTLAATLREDHVCVLDPATGKERARFPLYPADALKKLGLENFAGRSYSAWSLAVSPDGKRLAAAAVHGLYVAVWDAETGAEVARLDHGFPVMSVAFAPGGKAVITFGPTGLGYRWDVEKLIAVQKK